MILCMVARPPDIWELSPFQRPFRSAIYVVGVGIDDATPTTAYDVFAAAVLLGPRRLQLQLGTT